MKVMNDSAKLESGSKATSGNITLLAYDAFPDTTNQKQEYVNNLVNANFNAGFFLSSETAITNALKAISQSGKLFKLIVSNPALLNESKQQDFITAMTEVGGDNLWGYALSIHPKYNQLSTLKTQKERLTSLIGNKGLYVQLSTDDNPTYLGNFTDYGSYLKYVVTQLNPNPLSFEIYPYRQNGCGYSFTSDEFFKILKAFAMQSCDTGMPFWGFCNVQAMTMASRQYPNPTEEMIRMVVMSQLAMGAQGIVYRSLYQSVNSDTKTYTLAPINRERQRTALWRYIKDVNAEVLSLSNVFYGSTLLDFVLVKGQKSTMSQGIASPNGELPISGLSCVEEGVMGSLLQTGTTKYVMLINTDFQRNNRIGFSIKSGTFSVVGGSDNATSVISGKREVLLPPGGYVIYKWNV